MDREAWFLLAVGLFILAALVVSAAGWTLFARERRAAGARRAAAEAAEATGGPEEASADA